MDDDQRCCGSGTCIIDAEGHCWCGQQWDGEKMSFAPPSSASKTTPERDDDSRVADSDHDT